MAICYEFEKGCTKNIQRAIEYYGKAAKLGDEFCKKKYMFPYKINIL